MLSTHAVRSHPRLHPPAFGNRPHGFGFDDPDQERRVGSHDRPGDSRRSGSVHRRALETQGADVTIAAHSLGNMVVSQAIAYSAFTPSRYYMITGTVTREAFDAEQQMTDDTLKRVETEWRPYTNAGQWRLLAANCTNCSRQPPKTRGTN